MKRTLAIVSVAGGLCSVALGQTATPPAQPIEMPRQPAGKAVEIRPDEKTESPDLRVIAGRAGKVFDGVLIRKETVLPPGMTVFMTEYVFQVNEWFKGQQAAATVTVMEPSSDTPL